MKKLLARLYLVCVICLGSMSGTAQADVFGGFFKERDLSKLYYGIGLGDGTIQVNGDDDRSLGALSGTIGFQLIDLLGVELQLGAASDDAQSVLSESQLVYGSALIRAGIRIGQVGVYALFGQAVLDTSNSLDFSESGAAMGVGLNLFGNDTSSLNLNFMRIDDGAFTNASIGYQYYFGGYR